MRAMVRDAAALAVIGAVVADGRRLGGRAERPCLTTAVDSARVPRLPGRARRSRVRPCRQAQRMAADGVAGEVGFVHLRVHSAYSLLEGALPIKRLAELAAADRMPALGIADTGNLFGALEFAETLAGQGHPADRRLPAGGRFRRRCRRDAGTAAPRQTGVWPISSSSPPARTATGTSSGWSRIRSSATEPGVTAARCRIARLAACADGADRAHRRSGRPDRPRDPVRQERSRRGAPRPASRRLRRPALRRAAAARQPRAKRPSSRVLIDLAYRRAPAAGGDQRAVLFRPRRLRGPRRADRDRRGHGHRRRQAPPADARSTISSRAPR